MRCFTLAAARGLLCLLACTLPTLAASPWTVSSPNGRLTISLKLERKAEAGPVVRAWYSVAYRGRAVIVDSPLGLRFKGAPAWSEDLRIVGTKRRSPNRTWKPVAGARSQVRDRCSELEVALEEDRAPRRRVNLFLRAYDEGVGLRYELPAQPALGAFVISSEETGFRFPGDPEAWALNLGKFGTHYEGEFRKVRVSQIASDAIIGLPLLVHPAEGPWMAVLEADLTAYAGMYLRGAAGGLAAILAPLPGRADEAVIAKTPHVTPWRVIMVADTPGALIENNYLVQNFSRPCALEDTAWIVPGKTSLFWWTGKYPYETGFAPGPNTATYKHFVDFSAQHHLEYMLLDDGWSSHDDITTPVAGLAMEELLAYARSRNVRLLLWAPWKAVDRQMEQAFARYRQWGIAGIKVDFMNRDDQEMVAFCERVTRAAAANRLLVDFHGTYKPTGESRTYPNLVVREAVLGLEYSLWSGRASPEHDVTIPFTRMLAGPMDYAPGSFLNATRAQFKPRDNEPMAQGTRAHLLAMYVVFEAPLAMVWGYPEGYRDQAGMEFIERVPTAWDETRVLSGSVGESIVIARRRGDTWYIGGMTSWDARDTALHLDFLGAGRYSAEVFADGPDAATNATDLRRERTAVTASSVLNLHMAPGGGFALIVKPDGR